MLTYCGLNDGLCWCGNNRKCRKEDYIINLIPFKVTNGARFSFFLVFLFRLILKFLSASVLCSLPHFLLLLCFLFLWLCVLLDTSTQQDWCYLNEDGELGLAYQGLKQVARSQFVCFLLFCSLSCTFSSFSNQNNSSLLLT